MASHHSTRDSLGQLLNSYGRAPLLSERAVIELFKQYRAGLADDATPRQKRISSRAKERILTCNLRLAVSVALKRRLRAERAGMSLEDLVQEAIIGLNRAVELFEYTKGYRFSTYAHWWCLQSVGRSIDTYGLIHIPTGPAGLIKKLRHAPPEAINTREKLLSYLDITPAQLQSLEKAMAANRVASLDWRLSADDGETSELGDFVVDPNSTPSLEGLDHQLALEQLEAALPADLQVVQQSLVVSQVELARQEGVTRDLIAKRLAASKARLRAVGGNFAQVVAA